MKTTIILDDDAAEMLRAEMRHRRTNNFKETVNDALRRGLLACQKLAVIKPFKVRARHMGSRPGLNYDNVGELVEQLECLSRS